MEGMEQFDIQLENEQLFWLNICLAFLMFGVALDIRIKDFKALYQHPKSVLTGITAQWILLPAFTFLLLWILRPSPGVALGMLLVAACPGGNMSNFLVHLSGSNAALSVTLTSLSTSVAFIITPLNFLLWGSLYPPTAEIIKRFTLDPWSLLWILTQLILIPLFLGMLCRVYLPKITIAIRPYIKVVSVILFLGIIAGAVWANIDKVFVYLKHVFLLVFIHNLMAYFLGYIAAKSTRQNIRNTRTIIMETGIQNSGLGLIIIFNFYGGMSAMTLVAAWWGIWHLISGFSLATYWSKRPIPALGITND